MKSTLFIVTGLAIFIAIKTTTVQGLQCYVCEDCNEYEDLKELQICGEISVITTQRPTTTIPDIVVINQITTFNVSVTTIKPSRPSDTDDYLYENSMESQDGTRTTTKQQMGGTNGAATTMVGTTFPTTLNTQNSLGRETTIMATTIPTTLPAGNTQTNAVPFPVTTLKSVQQPVDYDYMEYEDPKVVGANGLAKASAKASLLKINEPVCYMFRYHANNTVFTKRGCTNSINDNTYLTCQSLYNGQPMSGCRICSTDGCNKYAYDESEEDHIYSAGVMKQISTVAISMLAVVTAVVL